MQLLEVIPLNSGGANIYLSLIALPVSLSFVCRSLPEIEIFFFFFSLMENGGSEFNHVSLHEHTKGVLLKFLKITNGADVASSWDHEAMHIDTYVFNWFEIR